MNGNWKDFLTSGNELLTLKEIEYGPWPDQKICLSLPKDKTSFPVIVWFHGGGLVNGERQCPDVFLNGEYGVAEIRYRFSGEQFKSTDSLDDAAKSVAWVMENAASFGGDPKKIIVGGTSAGAYLAAMAGMAPHLLKKYGFDHRKMAALVLVSGQMGTHFRMKADLKYQHDMWHPVIDEYAPLNYASPDLPPCIFITGDFGCDMPTRAEENAYFAAVLRALGHKDAHHYVLGGHDHSGVCDNSDWLCAQFVNRILKDL